MLLAMLLRCRPFSSLLFSLLYSYLRRCPHYLLIPRRLQCFTVVITAQLLSTLLSCLSCFSVADPHCSAVNFDTVHITSLLSTLLLCCC